MGKRKHNVLLPRQYADSRDKQDVGIRSQDNMKLEKQEAIIEGILRSEERRVGKECG